MSTVAVVVLNWNGLADTRALLPTLAACRLPPGWSLTTIVVDNGSTDGSAAAIAAEFPEVTLLALPENRRFAGGNNPGLRLALERGADAIMLLNNDTRADPGLIERLLVALDEVPSAGAGDRSSISAFRASASGMRVDGWSRGSAGPRIAACARSIRDSIDRSSAPVT